MYDCLIIGGGVIGLSLAYELARRSRRVCVLDRSEPGRAASWAGAGMLPPASPTSTDPLEQFCHLSNRLHVEWAKRLREETGIDTGYRRCGAIYVACETNMAAELRSNASNASKSGVRFDEITARDLKELAPAIDGSNLQVAFHAPDECQLRNPWHLKALAAACGQHGVEILSDTVVEDFEVRGDAIAFVHTPRKEFRAKQYCISSGAWSAELADRLGLRLPLKPIRGQIALLRLSQRLRAPIINEGSRYLVPRDDGRVLVGSTMEDVGFDTSTTTEAIQDLVSFAKALAPPLAAAELESSWAGLRPASADTLPFLGRVPKLQNCFIAAGHTRSGLHLSPATALVMADLMSGETPQLNLKPFRLDRHRDF